MTPEERQELRRWSAEDLLGWKLVVFEAMSYKETDEWGMVLRNADGAPYICYHHRDPMWLKPDGIYFDPQIWRPDSDDAPAWQLRSVIEKMRELGFYLNIEGYHDGYVINFNTSVDYPGPQDFNDNLAIGILTAARAAWESNHA